MDTMGARIRSLRQARGLTLLDLADGRLSISLVSKIERDLVRPSLPTLEHLAARLGTSASALLGASDAGSDELAVARAEAALASGDPEEALAALAVAEASAAVLALRGAALLAMGRDDDAIASTDATRRGSPPSPAIGARVELVRAHVLARRGLAEPAQEAFGRALQLLPAERRDLRAEALLGMARLAERAGSATTARSLYAQALVDLAAADDPIRRAASARRRGEGAASGGDAGAAIAAFAAAEELALLARAAATRAETANHLAELELASGRPEQALQRYREASDSMAHRAVRHPR